MERAKAAGALVVVGFYRTSCGSCKYIEQGFAKLCKCAGDSQAEPEVVFLKHNDVASVTQLNVSVEDVFAIGDLQQTIKTLASMSHCLSAGGEVSFLRGGICQA